MATSSLADAQRAALDEAEQRIPEVVDALDVLIAQKRAVMVGDIANWPPELVQYARKLLAIDKNLDLSLASLRARHANFGTYEAERKVKWCRIAVSYAQANTETGETAKGTPKIIKPSDETCERVAHADTEY